MSFEWDKAKDELNARKHGIRFADTFAVFEDPNAMKVNYDFTGGRRGAVVPTGAGKERITIRLDHEVLAWFRSQVEKAGGGNYQTLINRALREYMSRQAEPLEQVLRRVVREELHAVH